MRWSALCGFVLLLAFVVHEFDELGKRMNVCVVRLQHSQTNNGR